MGWEMGWEKGWGKDSWGKGKGYGYPSQSWDAHGRAEYSKQSKTEDKGPKVGQPAFPQLQQQHPEVDRKQRDEQKRQMQSFAGQARRPKSEQDISHGWIDWKWWVMCRKPIEIRI